MKIFKKSQLKRKREYYKDSTGGILKGGEFKVIVSIIVLKVKDAL